MKYADVRKLTALTQEEERKHFGYTNKGWQYKAISEVADLQDTLPTCFLWWLAKLINSNNQT